MPNVGFKEWWAVGRAIADGEMLRYNDSGRFTQKFEEKIGAMIGAKHVITVNGGTSALTCCLAAAGIGPGDEVLVPAYTWMATAAAAVMVGAVPVLVDIDESLTIDPADIEAKITPLTKAIIPVHMINVPCDMDAIMAIAKKHNLVVIEDACQAVGVQYKDRYCGAIGDAGAFSFNKYKNMNIGEGGAVITSDDRLFARARNYHDLGAPMRGHDETYNEKTFVGGNMRATEIEGAMLGAQLKKLQPMLNKLKKQRRVIAEIIEGNDAL
ncbi:MAG: aminotransferase class V-fold PLP-dependent enzyme, partial [Hyphomonadaceae bacterium]